ncbi:MAG TPA: 30S ribosomal protein S4 [Limnochordia bacterium]|nr:30S ribosomal protein S4 [Limnochordia bacterium]
MARYTGPVCRLCRREGEKLFLKGEKCYTDKCPVARRTYPPGQHGQGRQRKSDYASHLREKQKLRRIYGVLERQFESYYEEASRGKGVTGEELLQLLERRLDNVVYRLGFAGSRAAARQLVRHGHIAVGGHKVNIPSYLVREGDEIVLREGSRQIPQVREALESQRARGTAEWLQLAPEQFTGRVLSLPKREQIDVQVQEHLVVEHYSR